MMSKRLAAPLLALVLLASAACGEKPKPGQPPTPVTVQAVQAAHQPGGPRFAADIRPRLEVPLAFKVGGYVSRIMQVPGPGGPRPVQEGDRVAAGAVLAHLKDDDFAVKVSQARAQLAEAQAALEEATLVHDRAAKLMASRSLIRPEYEAAKARHEAAQARAQLARAQVREAELALAETSLKSPSDLMVLKRGVEAGSLVAPGTLGFLLADVSAYKAVFGVPEGLLPQVRPGAQLEVTSQALPGLAWPGWVSQISPAADPKSRVYEVELTLSAADPRLRLGMITSLRLPGQPAPLPTLTVPLASIVRPPQDSQGFAVFVAQGTGEMRQARLQVVELGATQGNAIGITSGLAPGQEVVVKGASQLRDGQAIRVVRP